MFFFFFYQWIKFKLDDKPINLVENENRSDPFSPRLLNNNLGLRLDAFHNVDNDNGTIAETNCSRHFTESNMKVLPERLIFNDLNNCTDVNKGFQKSKNKLKKIKDHFTSKNRHGPANRSD